MSLVRAFTTRRNRTDKPSTTFLGRAATQRSPTKATITRSQISAPINLVSSTNVLSFDAPDIAGTVPMPLAHPSERFVPSRSSDSSSRSSGEHSDGGSSTGVREYSTDDSSVGSSPNSPEPNHLSCYFKPSVYTDVPSRFNSLRSSQTSRTSFDAPVVPQRAASHSKKAHMHVSRQRSISRMRSPPSTATEFARGDGELFRADEFHPFGKELEQLNEAVEEFGGVGRDAEAEADHAFMEAHGLGYFCATDYMVEIADMLHTIFEEDHATSDQAEWI